MRRINKWSRNTLGWWVWDPGSLGLLFNHCCCILNLTLWLTRCELPRQLSTKSFCFPSMAQTYVWLVAAASACWYSELLLQKQTSAALLHVLHIWNISHGPLTPLYHCSAKGVTSLVLFKSWSEGSEVRRRRVCDCSSSRKLNSDFLSTYKGSESEEPSREPPQIGPLTSEVTSRRFDICSESVTTWLSGWGWRLKVPSLSGSAVQ